MALLVSGDSQIEGPQVEILNIVYGSLVRTLIASNILESVADQISVRALTRIQAALAGGGYVTRDLEQGAGE